MTLTPFFLVSIFSISILSMLILGYFVYKNGKKSATNILFLLMSISTCAWLFFMCASYLEPLYPYYLWITRLIIICSTIMNLSFFLFAHTIPEKKLRISNVGLGLLLASSLAIIIMNLTRFSISGVQHTISIPQPINGPGMAIFGAYSLFLNIAAITVLYRHIKNTVSENVQPLKYILIGITVMYSLIFGTIFLPVLVNSDITFVPIAPLYIFLFLALTAYAVLRHGLFNLKIISTELFCILVVYISLLQFNYAESFLQKIIQFTIFIITLFVSFALSKSVKNEVRKSEELRQLSAQLEEMNSHLKELDQMKSEFISMASHQLRTPISVIKGYISLIEEGAYGKVNVKLGKIIRQIYEMNERMVNMVNNLLNISRIERNKIAYSCTEVDIVKIVKEMVEQLNTSKTKDAVKLKVGKIEKIDKLFYGDSDKIREVLGNLIDNAIKYTSKGEVVVSASVAENPEFIKISVSDSGQGMTTDDMAHAFEKFYRSPQAQNQTGTGLGLYVCEKFIKAMGGTIWIEKTVLGKGTVFSFEIPTKPSGECALPSALQKV